MTAAARRDTHRRAARRHVMWLAGVTALSAVILWPALTTWGMLAQRDLLVIPRLEVPRSLYLMGPDLGRRLPAFVPLAIVASVIGGLLTGRLMLLASLVAAGYGMARLVSTALPAHSPVPRWLRLALPAVGAAALLSAPVMLTRLSVGHLTTLWALAATPFLLTACARHGGGAARSRSTAAAALLGMVAGMYSLVLVLGGTPIRRDRQSVVNLARTVRAWSSRNAVWLVPGAYLQLHGFATFVDAENFRPHFGSAAQLLGLVVGRGYWDPGAEALRGHDGMLALSALALIGLGTLGWRQLDERLRGPVTAALVVGYGAPLFAVAPVTRRVAQALVSTPFGAPFREPHRLVGLGVVPLLLLAVLGVVELGTWSGATEWRRRAPSLGVIGLAALSTGLVWGALPTVHRRLEPVAVPGSWTDAAALVAHEGGSVLTLPWSEYVLLDIDRPRPVYHPLADLFGPDTMASSDPAMGPPVNEAADPRAPVAAAAAAQLLAGRYPQDHIEALRIRWIAVLRVEQWNSIDLAHLPQLRREVSSPTLDLYRVLGAPVPADRAALPFVVRTTGVADIPWTWGWVDARGGLIGRTAAGLTDTRGTAVYLPAAAGLGLFGWTVGALLRPRKSRSSPCQGPAEP